MVAVSTVQTPLPSSGGDRTSFVFVVQIVVHLLQEFLVGTEVSRLLAFLEQAQVLTGAFGEHKRAAGRYLHSSIRLKVTVYLTKETKVNSGGTEPLNVVIPIKLPVLDKKVWMVSCRFGPSIAPNSHRYSVFCQVQYTLCPFPFV